jgi:hypothetical protein
MKGTQRLGVSRELAGWETAARGRTGERSGKRQWCG